MGILLTIDRCIHMISHELIANKVIFAEVDKESYDGIELEFSKITGGDNIVFKEEKVSDIGKCKILNFNGFTVIITKNNTVKKEDNFYIAFKTKIV